MKIEKGKFYKTRDGEKVFILDVGLGSVWPIRGVRYHFRSDNLKDFLIETWSENGSFFDRGNGSPLDIVSEWTDEEELVDHWPGICKYVDGTFHITDDIYPTMEAFTEDQEHREVVRLATEYPPIKLPLRKKVIDKA